MTNDTGDLFDQQKQRVWSCPRCRKPLRRIEGKMGPFWGCTGWPACEQRLHDRDGRPSEQPDERYRCPVCTRPLVRAEASKKQRNASGGTHYWYCNGYNKGCKVTLDDTDGRPAEAWRCPRCGHLLRQRQGKHGRFWGCSQYPLCQASFPGVNSKPQLPEGPGPAR